MLFYCISLLVGKYRQKKRDCEIFDGGRLIIYIFIYKNLKVFAGFIFFFYICTNYIHMSNALIVMLFSVLDESCMLWCANN